MAGTCYLVYSGGTINLQEHAAGMDLTYTPQSKNMADEFAKDNARLRISKASITSVRDALGSISRAFQEAQTYNNYGGGTAPVYLYMQPAGYPDAWRSEIINANITPADYVSNSVIWEATTGLKTIEFDMDLTRRNYFEGTLTPLTLANPNGTSGTVYWDNYNDGGGAVAGRKRYNYVDVAGTAVIGDMLAPVKLTVTDVNASGSPDFIGFSKLNIHVGWSADRTATTRFEAELGTIFGVILPSTGASSGTIVGTADAQRNALSDYDKYQGNYYEVYSKVGLGTLTSVKMAARTVVNAGYTLVNENTPVSIFPKVPGATIQWNDLGQLHFPNNYIGGTINANVLLDAYCTTSDLLDFDVVHALPMDKRISASSGTIHQMVFDTITGFHYSYGGYGSLWGTATVRPLTVYGDLALMPGKDQRIHFLDTACIFPALGTAFFTVSVSYRPRRLTL